MPPRPPIPTDDLYARLEVPPDATFEAIEIAWRALLKRHHPDVAGQDGLEAAKRINVAHDWLSDPALRGRYDAERRGARVRASASRPYATPPHQPRRRAPARPARTDPGASLRRFLDRVARLTRDELDRLSLAETNSIAFVASIQRFLSPSQIAALEEVERAVRARLPRDAWANAFIRDAVLAAAHELVLAPFLDEHLTEPSRGRARDRLMRGWEAAIDQPRYGPNSPAVERFLAWTARLTPAEVRALGSAVRGAVGDPPWPPGLDPEEDDGLRVSTLLAARDAANAAAHALAGLDRATAARAAAVLRRTAHAVVLRHAFSSQAFESLVHIWQSATGDPATGRATDTPAEPRIRRR